MSGGFAPSRSTVYVSNLDFQFTNNDLHQMFDKFGKIARITIVKDKETRRSKGVAFVLFVERASAEQCVADVDGTTVSGRVVKCSIAKDNGRTSEFMKEGGHMSYECPRNSLGARERPVKQPKRKRASNQQPPLPSLVSHPVSSPRAGPALSPAQLQALLSAPQPMPLPARKTLKSGYFSDEDASD